MERTIKNSPLSLICALRITNMFEIYQCLLEQGPTVICYEQIMRSFHIMGLN